MLVALGFALALVIVLLVARGFWSMAMRLGARKQAKQIPVAMLELQADRDRLRAEHAMMARKLELRLDDIKARMTEQMAEVSRNRNRVQSMTVEMERRDELINNRDHEVGTLVNQLELYKADLAACADAIDRYGKEVVQKDTEIARQASLIAQLSSNLRDKGQLVSTLGNELQTALRSDDENKTTEKTDTSENRLLQRVAELTSISTQMSNQRDGNTIVPESLEAASQLENIDPQLVETTVSEPVEEMNVLNPGGDEKSPPEIKAAPESPPKKSGAMANVISLAQRIRALQKNSG